MKSWEMKSWEMNPEKWLRHDRDQKVLSHTQYWREHDISEYEKQKTRLISDLHHKLRLAESALEALLSPIPEMRMDLENDALRLLDPK
jgi:hypothetical protein